MQYISNDWQKRPNPSFVYFTRLGADAYLKRPLAASIQ